MKKRYVQAMMAGMTAMLSLTLPVSNVWAAVPQKEQTVYVNADENGNTEKVIVSNWLKNEGKETSLEDKSDLTNIKNVKGEETYSQGSDGNLVWAADGKDIYYQGETKKELPVSVKLTYSLDGKEMPASEMKGKSGKVKIRVDYENKAVKETEINGKKETVCTPFMMTTGMILPAEKFTNVEVKNGKVISDGRNDIVVGIGFPGLSESLKLSETEALKEKEIPDYLEITADVEDFSLALTATVATTGNLKELGLDKIEGMDDLEEKLDTLSESSQALTEGSKALLEGVQQLNSSADTFVDGLNSADSGAGQLKDGIDTMNSKKGELLAGISQLTAGMGDLQKGAQSLETGVASYTGGAEQLAAGISQTEEGAAALKAGMDTLNQKEELTAGVQQLAAGAQTLEAGAGNFKQQLGAYTEGVQKLSAGLGMLCKSMGLVDALPNWMLDLSQGVSGMNSSAQVLENQAKQAAQTAGEVQSKMTAFNETVNNARASSETALQAAEDIQIPDMQAVASAASNQAQAAVTAKMADINAQANAQANEQQSMNVETALSAAGLTEEQKNAVRANLGNIFVSADTPQVQVSLPAELTVDNTAAQQRLAQAGAELETAQKGLDNNKIDTKEVERLQEAAQAAAGNAKDMQNNFNRMSAQLNTAEAKASRAGQQELANSLNTLYQASVAICGVQNENNQALNAGAQELAAGASNLNTGVGTLAKGAAQLGEGVSRLADGTDILYKGSSQLKTGASALIANNFALISGAKQLSAGSSALLAGGAQLQEGAGVLSGGIQQLAGGSSALKDGTAKLAAGGKELKAGTVKLESGAAQLTDGMQEFDREGIQKLTEVLEGEAKEVLDRLKAIVDNDKEYTAFDGAENADGNVKFIIETAGIE